MVKWGYLWGALVLSWPRFRGYNTKLDRIFLFVLFLDGMAVICKGNITCWNLFIWAEVENKIRPRPFSHEGDKPGMLKLRIFFLIIFLFYIYTIKHN